MFKNIICVTDRKICTAPFLEQVQRICRLHPQGLILREKDLTEAAYLSLAQQVQPICQSFGVKFIAHSFWRAALALQADAVHLPLPLLKSLGAKERSLLPVTGCSVHSMEEVRQAMALGADYLIAGHIYTSSCKPGAAPRGPQFLRAACLSAGVPVYAIGGIGLDGRQIKEVLACGAQGVCIRSALMRL